MKRILLLVTILALTLLVPSAAIAQEAQDGKLHAKLIAGQNDWVGQVIVWNDAENLYVRYVIFTYPADPCIQETHLHVATSLDGIPQANGNPIPGQFDYKDDNLGCVREMVYTIPLEEGWTPGTVLYIAAHAALSNGETAWGLICGRFDLYSFPGPNWAAYTQYVVQ